MNELFFTVFPIFAIGNKKEPNYYLKKIIRDEDRLAPTLLMQQLFFLLTGFLLLIPSYSMPEQHLWLSYFTTYKM